MKRIGSYKLSRLLGSGAMGEVWLGEHERTGSLAAVKIVKAVEGRATPHLETLFARERRAVARLAHPHVVRLHDLGPDYIVTSYIEGSDLQRWMRENAVSPARAVHLTRQIASALAHAHERGIVHRDVKPANILVDVEGNAALTDFGIAVLREESKLLPRAGTPAYMAPEQDHGGVVGPEADQYALARTLLRMLVGRKISRDRDKALERFPAELPDALRDALDRATKIFPGDRFPSMVDFEKALAGIDLSDYPTPPPPPLIRDAQPFDWVTGATSTQDHGPDIMRGDYKLSQLEAAGLLTPEACEAWREATGYADFGWTVWARSGRLGSLSDAETLARAGQLAVLLHGFVSDRHIWNELAMSLCRDDGGVVVLAPDLYGFGESRFRAGQPSDGRQRPEALVKGVARWLDLLGLSAFPTLWVGHSMGAIALLSQTDDELGIDARRVAVTPLFPFVDPFLRWRLRSGPLLGLLNRFSLTRRLGADLIVRRAPESRMYTSAERERFVGIYSRADASGAGKVAAGFADSRPPSGAALDHCTLVVMTDDPVAREERVWAALEALDYDRDRVERLEGGGAHLPQAELEEHPEWTARNVSHLATILTRTLAEMPGATTRTTAFTLDDQPPKEPRNDSSAERSPSERAS